MNPLERDPVTGFLESKSLLSHARQRLPFSAERKSRFLELALKTAEQGGYPDIKHLCEVVNVGEYTVYEHLKKDDVFKSAWEQVLRRIENKLVQVMVANGQTPKGFMDRIAFLRRHFPEWNPESKVQITRDNNTTRNVIDAIPVDTDPELVDNQGVSSLEGETVGPAPDGVQSE